MSKPINPLTIGSFTLGALALLFIGFFIFGGGSLINQDKLRFVIFFDSSLNGLDIGAPVKMQGVKIGEVSDIALMLNPKTGKIYKPVVIDIDPKYLVTANTNASNKLGRDKQQAVTDKLVELGFRARLEMQSLLTGLLYVDFDVHPEKRAVFAGFDYKGLSELPGIPTTSDEIFNTAEQLAQKLSNLPLEQIVTDLSDSLKEVKELLSSDETKKTSIALGNTLVEMEKTLNILNRNLGAFLGETQKTVASTHTLINHVQSNLDPLLTSMNQTLQTTQQSMRYLGDVLGPNSALYDTLQSLKATTRSIKNLTDYLERHPETILSGKE